MKIQCADCGSPVPSGHGRRIVISDIITEFGFVDGADLVYQAQRKTGGYHGEFCAEKFEHYLREVQEAPKLKALAGREGKSGAVLVMDNAAYHSRKPDHLKRPKKVKQAMKDWLDANGIEYPSKCTNDVLSKLISEFLENVEKKFVVDTFLLDEYGIYVLRLPLRSKSH